MKILNKELNPQEIYVGMAHSLAWIPFQGYYGLAAAPLSGFFWALGGASGSYKAWRRIVCPLLICGSVAVNKWGLWPLISLPLTFLVLSTGYGIPSWNGPGGSQDDKGSMLGRFCYYALCNGPDMKDLKAERCATVKTRAILAILFGLAMVSLCAYSWVYWVVGVVVLTILIPTIVSIF